MEQPEQAPPPPQQHLQPPPGLPLVVPQHSHNAPYLPNPEERTMGMLIHLLGIITGFLGPLILWLVKRQESAFIDHHGKEAMNFMITNIICYLVLIAITVVTFGIGFILIIPWGIALLVLTILACIAANQGEWHRIPMTIRFIR